MDQLTNVSNASLGIKTPGYATWRTLLNNRLSYYKQGGQLVSRNPITRFKQGGVSSFGKAFREARNAGLKEFEWNGKKYTTELKEEKEARENKVKPKMKQMFVPDDKNKKYFKTDSGHVASIGPMSIKFIPK
jgi:hypothetical protein